MNSGSSASARLIFTVPRARAPVLDVLDERRRQLRRARSARRNVIFGWIAVTTSGADSSSPPSSATPTARPSRISTRSTARVRADLGAERLRRGGTRVADGAHAALGIAPARDLAVADVADRVVHHHVRGAGRVRTRPRADDPVHRLQPDEHLVLEPAPQQVGRAHREQPRDVGDRLLVDLLAELPSELRDVLDVADLLRARRAAASPSGAAP